MLVLSCAQWQTVIAACYSTVTWGIKLPTLSRNTFLHSVNLPERDDGWANSCSSTKNFALRAGTAQDTLHICDAVECKLPAEDWFESNKKVNTKS